MKNKRMVKVFAAMLCMVSLTAVSCAPVNSAKDAEVLHSEVGKMFSDSSKVESQENDLYAVGKNTTIAQRDMDLAVEFYKAAGAGEDDARKQAEHFVFGREALYYKAVQEGYQVTDEEVNQYIEQCRAELDDIANSNEIKAVIDQYDSEEDYWDHQFVIYQKDLPSQKYVQALEEEFRNEKRKQAEDSLETIDKDWAEYYSSYRNKLIEEEEYQLVNK